MNLPSLPLRLSHAHKGDFGRVLVMGGSQGMAGAPAMTAQAALRSGAGLVQVACPDAVRDIVAGLVPCAMTCPLDDWGSFVPTVRAIGPGGGGALTTPIILQQLADTSTPIVIDADGLNRLAEVDQWWTHCGAHVVLTPHPGEMARLVEPTTIDIPAADRSALASAVANLCGAVVVLKGYGTVVAEPTRAILNTTGNPGMATGGSGDVLTGIIAGLAAQGLTPFDAAHLGAHIHGLAGDLAVEEIGQVSLIASDLLDYLGDAFGQLD